MSTLKGKKILIVGGSSGIGLATAKAALAEGAAVTIASRDKAGLQAALQELGPSVASATVDLVDNKTIVSLFEQLGSFDHLVVTAASTKTGSVRSLNLDDAYASMNSKFWGAYRLVKAAKLNDGGSITLISGFLSHRPSPKAVLQGAINAAIEGLVRGLALEFAPLRVNAVSPGLIDTALYAAMPADAKADMLAKTRDKLPVHRVGTGDDVAQAILMLAANPYITGSTIVVDGGGTIAL
jgi:NAD(P)-dependent dehydrogenase (short-subunit alcohol dehydrogenase family)